MLCIAWPRDSCVLFILPRASFSHAPVAQIAQHGESKELLSLYQGADRLKRLLMVGWRNIPGRLRQDERHHGAQGHAHGGNSSSQRRPKQIEQQVIHK